MQVCAPSGTSLLMFVERSILNWSTSSLHLLPTFRPACAHRAESFCGCMHACMHARGLCAETYACSHALRAAMSMGLLLLLHHVRPPPCIGPHAAWHPPTAFPLACAVTFWLMQVARRPSPGSESLQKTLISVTHLPDGGVGLGEGSLPGRSAVSCLAWESGPPRALTSGSDIPYAIKQIGCTRCGHDVG
jgi:hypothetical protein